MEKSDFITWASKLQHSYIPNQEVLRRISSIDLVAIVGPTGVGKTSIIKNLNIPVVVSDVTREKRPDEKDGKSYSFKVDYLKIIEDIKAGNYVQFIVSSSGEFYGTHINAYSQHGVYVMAIYAKEIYNFKKLGFRSIDQYYIMPPSYIEWMNRIGGVRSKDLLDRIQEAKESILLALEDSDYTFVLNDNLDLAVNDILKNRNKQAIDLHRVELAIGTADILLEHIGESDSEIE
jgi:guanylate kinase